MACQTNNNCNDSLLSCGTTCDIKSLMAQYPTVDFQKVFCLIFKGLKELGSEDCC
jgi:hypothetical protein